MDVAHQFHGSSGFAVFGTAKLCTKVEDDRYMELELLCQRCSSLVQSHTLDARSALIDVQNRRRFGLEVTLGPTANKSEPTSDQG